MALAAAALLFTMLGMLAIAPSLFFIIMPFWGLIALCIINFTGVFKDSQSRIDEDMRNVHDAESARDYIDESTIKYDYEHRV